MDLGMRWENNRMGRLDKPRSHAEAPPVYYGRGRSSSRRGWFKWKLDPYAVDCVLIGGSNWFRAAGRFYTDYTFAVWQDDSPTAELVTFAKAYSGLTQREIERLDRWIRTTPSPSEVPSGK